MASNLRYFDDTISWRKASRLETDRIYGLLSPTTRLKLDRSRIRHSIPSNWCPTEANFWIDCDSAEHAFFTFQDTIEDIRRCFEVEHPNLIEIVRFVWHDDPDGQLLVLMRPRMPITQENARWRLEELLKK